MIALTPWTSTTVTTSDARPVAAIMEIEQSVDRESSVHLDPDRPWRRYLEGLSQSSGFTRRHIAAVESVWKRLRNLIGEILPLPRTQPTAHGAIQLAWYSDRYTVEIDVLADARIEWFVRDRVARRTFGTDEEPTAELPAELLPLLRSAVQ